MNELDTCWLPIVKSWRLNEVSCIDLILSMISLNDTLMQSMQQQRMYGALTGKSKQMIANEYGEDQLKVIIRTDSSCSSPACRLLTYLPL
jgi:bisphosphoglycerate-dependent phosphoglycerate mutase